MILSQTTGSAKEGFDRCQRINVVVNSIRIYSALWRGIFLNIDSRNVSLPGAITRINTNPLSNQRYERTSV